MRRLKKFLSSTLCAWLLAAIFYGAITYYMDRKTDETRNAVISHYREYLRQMPTCREAVWTGRFNAL